MRPALRATLVGLAAVLAATLPTASQAAGTPAPKPHRVQMPYSAENNPAPTDYCGPASADPVPDGEPIVVDIPPGPAFTVGQIPASWWQTPPYGDAGWQLHLRGFMWVEELAQRAAQDDQQESLTALVDQVIAFHAQNPDPGTSTATTTADANRWGWDEGTALRRLAAESCLYSKTHDARLVPGMEADVEVNYGPRFYGPPRYMVHNHGVMADLNIVRAGDLLGLKDWVARSLDRLVADAPSAWTPAEVTIEQSSSYDLVNVSLWRQAATDVISHRGADDPSSKSLSALVAKANSVVPWLTEPSRFIVVIGDSVQDAGQTRSTWTTPTFHDNASGWAVGRWSWTDPNTNYYTVRYGPRRTAHGQADRPGATWTTLGVRVLVNPGKGNYDTAGNFYAWVRSPSSHNVSTADRRTYTDGTVTLTSNVATPGWQTWATSDALFGIAHTRAVAVARNPRTMIVTDTYASGAAFHQFWHLDPTWALTSRSSDGKKMTFKAGTRALTVTTTGTATVTRGVTRPMSGWNFPTAETHVPASQIQVVAAGSAKTTFVVT